MKALPLLAAALVAALLAVGGWWFALERRWQGPLYCIARPGALWNGLAPLPAGLTPECPQSRSYRQEVRQGESRVEQYRLPGWHPKALLGPLKAAGFTLLTDDPIAPGNYASFLNRGGVMLHYLATLEGDTTLITLSGRP